MSVIATCKMSSKSQIFQRLFPVGFFRFKDVHSRFAIIIDSASCSMSMLRGCFISSIKTLWEKNLENEFS